MSAIGWCKNRGVAVAIGSAMIDFVESGTVILKNIYY
jgi:hypothetical protein